MRKNAPRKWIHAILDLLPLLVIPIFAIYTRNESNTFNNNIELQVEENKVVEFNQLFNPKVIEPVTVRGLTLETFDDGTIHISGTCTQSFYYGVGTSLNYISGHKYLLRNNLGLSGASFYTFGDTSKISSSVSFISSNGNALTNNSLGLYVSNGVTLDVYTKPNLFDLTLMFGVGNEPTIEQFGQWYTEYYYSYNVGETQLLKTGIYETLNNTDIGSQFLYSVYKPVNDYFNFNNLFNMQGIYDWLQLNLFGGNAPLPVLIVWNIIVYEFFIDLIFLLYSVFMFIIDFATHMIDSFTGRCR